VSLLAELATHETVEPRPYASGRRVLTNVTRGKRGGMVRTAAFDRELAGVSPMHDSDPPEMV